MLQTLNKVSLTKKDGAIKKLDRWKYPVPFPCELIEICSANLSAKHDNIKHWS